MEAIIEEIEAKISKLSGLPPDLSEEYDALRAEFAKKSGPRVSISTESGTATTGAAKVTVKKAAPKK